MKEKRKHNKKSEYWNKFSKTSEALADNIKPSLLDTLPETAGDSFYVQEAVASNVPSVTNRRVGYEGGTASRRNAAARKIKSDKYVK